MLNLSRAARTHEDVFVQRYDALVAWTLHLCRDRQLAEDLVHDAFVAFVLARPALEGIENLDGYLRAMLRKLHVSHVRRATRRPLASLSMLDHESAELGLRAVGAATLEARTELACLCRYACLRKHSSKSGSVLILRFFHGYFPSEIASLAKCTPRAADEWLRIARREARLYRTAPGRLQFLDAISPDLPQVGVVESVATESPDQFLAAVQTAIFEAPEGRCDSRRALRLMYADSRSGAVDTRRLAHIVSCRRCLDFLNRLLNLSTLDRRSPHDMLGPGSRTTSDARLGRRSPIDVQRRSDRWRTTYEHRASELHVAVNGFLVGSHTIGQTVTRQTLAVNLDEPVGFVEVFSERGIRLAFLDVQPQPDGPVEQSATIRLSEDRRLEVTVSFGSAWPEVHVTYEDPHWRLVDLGQDEPQASDESRPREGVRQPPDRSTASLWRPRWQTALVGLGIVLVLLWLPHGTLAWIGESVRAVVNRVAEELGLRQEATTDPVPARPIPPVLAPLPRQPASTLAVPGRPQTRLLQPSDLTLLEVEALSRLDTIDALLGGQVDVQRSGSRIVVRGLVEDEARRQAITEALKPLSPPDAVRVEVRTITESVRQMPPATGPIQYRPLEFDPGGLPAASDLRAYLTRIGRVADIDSEVRRIATSALHRSRTALLHALVMESLAERYAPQALRDLNPQAYGIWMRLIASHGSAFGAETRQLRELLEPVFVSSDGAARADSDPDAGSTHLSVAEGVTRLGRLAVTIDDAIRSGLSASNEPTERVLIRETEFWRTVRRAERLAQSLAK